MTPIGAPRGLVVSLARSLNERHVSYCHWKSNASIGEALAGKGDLDLLIGRESIATFNEIAANLRFVRAYAKGGADVPGTDHFYGYDSEADAFVHIHAHYQLIFGHDRTKNIHLPIEDAYLKTSRLEGLLRLPDSNFEYILFVLRMTLKYAIWDEILWNGLRGKTAALKPSEEVEFLAFAEKIDSGRVSELLSEHFAYLGTQLFEDCVEILRGETSVSRRVSTGRRLQRTLAVHGRHAPLLEVSLRLWRRVAVSVRTRFAGRPRRRLASGGAIIAIIGGDGSGKTTALDQVYGWLRSEFEVRRIHLGKPRWSVTTRLVRGVLLMASKIAGLSRRAEKNIVERYRPVFWMVCKARDRFHSYRRARRYTTNGGLVVSDRYPHPSLRLMDAPQIEGMIGESVDGAFARRMMKIEEKYHRAIGLPEFVVALKVDPEIAVQRKTTESPESVRRRGNEIWNMTWDDGSVFVIDASKSKEQVAKEIKGLIWSRLA